MAEFRDWLEGERKSRHTVKEYTFAVSKFLSYLGKDLKDSTDEDIVRYKHYMAVQKKYSKSTQYLFLKAIKLYYKFRDLTPLESLKPPVRSKKLPVYLSDSETARLFQTASRSKRDLAIVMVLAYTGIRVSELCSLEMSDLDLAERTMRVRSGKGDKDRIVILSQASADKLGDYLAEKSANLDYSDAVFHSSRGNGRFDTSTIERLVRKLAVEAGIRKKVTPHVLRHTFATSVLRNGGDIRFIQQILGHSSVATTQIYTHIDDNLLKKMYEDHSPNY